MTELACRNCQRAFSPGHWNSRHCSEACRQAARRKRDRNRKRRKAAYVLALEEPNELRHVHGRCRQCNGYGLLTFDSYGPADDDYLDVTPEFCSLVCIVDFWKSRPGKPDVCLEIRRLLGQWSEHEARDRRGYSKSAELYSDL